MLFLKPAMLLLAVLPLVQNNAAAAGSREPSTAERIAIAKNTTKDPEERETAIKALANVSGELERDNKVVEELLEIAVREDDEPFVRVPSIETLGTLQNNVTRDNKAKNKYMEPFAAILKNTNESAPVRRAVAKVYRKTLDHDGLKDHDVAFRALLEIARSKHEPNPGLRLECIMAIGEFGDIEALKYLADMLNEEDSMVREKSAMAIYMLLSKIPEAGDKVLLPTITKLVDMLQDQRMSSDLQIEVMKALAQLLRNGNTAARIGLPAIKEIVVRAKDERLIVGAVTALGIIGTAEAVEPLKKTYEDFSTDADAKNEKAVQVRQAVVRALRSVLSYQRNRKPFDARATHEAATILVKVVDDDPSDQVKGSAVYAMRCLYPKQFESEQKEAVGSLIYLLRETKNDELKAKIPESLEYITQMDYGTESRRWFEWYDKQYPNSRRVSKKDTPR
jgi:HEAT repeat protein